jgi:hypothetical protein
MRKLERVEQGISFAAAAVVGVVRVYPLQVLRGGFFLQVFAVDDGSDGGAGGNLDYYRTGARYLAWRKVSVLANPCFPGFDLVEGERVVDGEGSGLASLSVCGP